MTPHQRPNQPPPQQPIALPPAVLPPPPSPTLSDRVLRTLLHAGVLMIALNALTPLLQTKPLGQTVLPVISPWFGVPFCVGASGGLHHDQPTLVILALVLTVQGWPNDLLPTLTAALVGASLGHVVRTAIKKGTNQ